MSVNPTFSLMEKPLNLPQEPSWGRSIASPEAEYLLEDPAGFLYSIPSFLWDTFHGYISRASVRLGLFVLEKVVYGGPARMLVVERRSVLPLHFSCLLQSFLLSFPILWVLGYGAA